VLKGGGGGVNTLWVRTRGVLLFKTLKRGRGGGGDKTGVGGRGGGEDAKWGEGIEVKGRKGERSEAERYAKERGRNKNRREGINAK
jgi:hypothetical protein